MYKKHLALLLFTLTSGLSHAETCPAGKSYCDEYGTKISAVYVNNGGQALIGLPGIDGWLTLGNLKESDAVKAMHSTALTAKSTGESRVWVSACG